MHKILMIIKIANLLKYGNIISYNVMCPNMDTGVILELGIAIILEAEPAD